jgi:uncharacterized membrane protein YbhN (UPF0104 family)
LRHRLIVGLLIGALALLLALWGVPLGELGAALGRARVAWLLPVAALFFVQQLLRSARQALLLHGATGAAYPLSLRQSLSVLCVSFLFINTLPARIARSSFRAMNETAYLSSDLGFRILLVPTFVRFKSRAEPLA